MKKAIVFLCSNPLEETIDFAIEIKRSTDFDVFIVVDNNTQIYDQDIAGIRFIQTPDNICIATGYYNSNIGIDVTHIKKNPIAIDKFLYSFCFYSNTDYDFVWVFEDDVFIPSIDHILNLHKNYCQYDLVTPNNFLKTDTIPDWHWKHIFNKIGPPYYYSMVCAMGLSRKMLNTIKDYVDKNKTLFYIEAMFNTLAMQNNLFVCDPLELKSIVWQGKWHIDEFLLLPNNVFHPRKDIENHPDLRDLINRYKKDLSYKPINTLPDFINNLL